MNLPNNTLLQGGKYRIVRFISAGGFGCTYEAEHVMLHKRVAIKEFFVKDFCNRDEQTSHVTVGTQSKVALVEKLRQKFIDEAVALSQLSHPNIVSVSDVFMENGTAYYVMDFIEGKSLHQIVSERGALPEQEAVGYIKEVAEALGYVHKLNRLHLDIKPGNIMVGKDGHAKLIDFGASKQYDEVDGENTSTLLGKTPGYAPIEQMGNRVQTFSAATDIYALGATFYKLITGETPADATEIADDEDALHPIPSSISVAVRKTIEKSMATRRKDRHQSIEEFLAQLTPGGISTKIVKEQIDEEATILSEEWREGPVVKVVKEQYSAVDLGLSVKWCDCNIGAKNPCEFGWYVGWGDAMGDKRSMDLEDYPSKNPPKNISDTEYDIATQTMGKGWRLPTKAEMDELITKCQWVWTEKSNVWGYLVIASNGNSIFLPAAGYRKSHEQSSTNMFGYYWTGDLANFSSAYALTFSSEDKGATSLVRYIGRSIRPVRD